MLTTSQVADRLGISTRTVERMVAAGELPVIRMGARCNRFRPAEIERLINSKEQKPKKQTMKKTAILAALVCLTSIASAANINDQLIDAIAFVESGNRPNAVGDAGRARGAMQFWVIAWRDTDQERRRLGKTVHPYSMATDPVISRDYAHDFLNLIQRRFKAKVGREPSVGELYAAYNCGLSSFLNTHKGDLNRVPVTTRRAIGKLEARLRKNATR